MALRLYRNAIKRFLGFRLGRFLSCWVKCLLYGLSLSDSSNGSTSRPRRLERGGGGRGGASESGCLNCKAQGRERRALRALPAEGPATVGGAPGAGRRLLPSLPGGGPAGYGSRETRGSDGVGSGRAGARDWPLVLQAFVVPGAALPKPAERVHGKRDVPPRPSPPAVVFGCRGFRGFGWRRGDRTGPPGRRRVTNGPKATV